MIFVDNTDFCLILCWPFFETLCFKSSLWEEKTTKMKVARKEGVHVCWHGMDDAHSSSNLNLATHSDVIIKNEHLKQSSG